MQTANLMQKGRTAIRSGHYAEARQAMRQAIRENPDNYAAWLLLARATPSTKAALEYVSRAEMLQPTSPLVQRARISLEQKAQKESATAHRGRRVKAAIFAGGLLLLLLVLAVWFSFAPDSGIVNAGTESLFLEAIIPTQPSNARQEDKILVSPFQKPVVQNELLPKQVEETYLEDTQTLSDPEEEIVIEEIVPIEVDDPLPPNSVEILVDEVVADGPQEPAADAVVEEEEENTAPEADPPVEETTVEIESFPVVETSSIRPAGVGETDQWIDVNLTTQTLVAYEGDEPVFNSLISSGTWDHPTVTGQFETWMKYESQDMNGYLLGYDYYLPGVPYVMYFYKDFAIHGTYWHTNFGQPMSHGCVNMDPTDAGWLFEWAPVGTTVNIHY